MIDLNDVRNRVEKAQDSDLEALTAVLYHDLPDLIAELQQ
ncbi:hypothetical protein SDC9_05897 [bioreactor metagenome]|uniref:Uncharacterized protein n=1 Tax=bioreactor metagenome TaxID=1076179 RepID=A0A644T072_9ZZZZ